MLRERPIGIDLGTTNSCVAWVDESGRTQMVPNAEGELLTPSIVLFSDLEVVVGKEARSATTVTPEQVAEWVKRDMGQPRYSRPIHGKYLPPEVIQACILQKLNSDVAGRLGPNPKVVITVPAYFDEPRRKATADAGEMAGLTVLDIVNEPTAAALAFGETLGYLSPIGGLREEMTVLVYDLGGGTFDCTLLRLAPRDIRTIATDGDVQLGGHDWDERLADYAAESFKRAHNLDPRRDPAGKNRLLAAVVEAKHALSARRRATIRVEHDGRASEIEITRDRFRELTADLLERTAYTTRQLLAEAKLRWKDVSGLLLVGGATRMPMVSEMLTQMSGLTPDHTVNPDEAVARGAALYASYLLAKQAEGGPRSTFEVTNVNSHSLGVEGIDQETLRKTNVILIRRNTALPANVTEKFITKSQGQRSIAVQILEGESSLPGECTAIGRTVIRELPAGLPKGWPVEVTFEYGTNGRLSVRAVVPGTHQESILQLQRTVGLTREGIARWKQPVSSSAGFSAFELMVEEILGISPQGGGSAGGASPGQAGAATMPAGHGAGAIPPGDAGAATAGQAPAAWAQPAAAVEPPGSSPAAAGPQPLAGEKAGIAGRGADQPEPAPQLAPHPAPGERPTPARRRPIPRWLVSLIGYVTSAIVGLGLGYLVLSWLRPDAFPRPW